MTDESPSRNGSQEGPVAGQRLAAARKARDISIFEVAKELHLDEHKVQALEENRFDMLGAPVFAKGHLRKYAQLVGVDIDDVMTDYYTMHRSEGAPPVVGAPRKQSLKLPPGPWLLLGVLLVVVVATYALWPSRPTESEASAPEVVGPDDSAPVAARPETALEAPPFPSADEPEQDTESEPESEEVPEQPQQAAPVPDPVPAAAIMPTPEPAPPQNAGDVVTLSMQFSGDCWTEITDSTGARLFFDLGRAGRTVTVTGVPPIRVLFGDGDNVTLSVDGSSRPILASERRGRTARFTIASR